MSNNPDLNLAQDYFNNSWSNYGQITDSNYMEHQEIYRLGQEVEVLEFPSSLSGEDVLRGFVLDLDRIF